MSTKITQFTKQNLPGIRTAVNDALSKVLRETYGITADAGNCSFDAATATFKLALKIDDPKVQEAQERKTYLSNCRLFDLRPEDFGTIVMIQGRQYKFVGFALSRTKYPIRLQDVATGKTTLYTETITDRIKAATDAMNKTA